MPTKSVIVTVAAAAAAGALVITAFGSDGTEVKAGEPAPVAAPAQASVEIPGGGAAVVNAADDEDEAGEIEDGDEEEETVALDRVPAHVLEAARNALEGFVPDSCEIDSSSGSPVYDVHGLVDGKTWEVEVTPDGKVLGTELDD